MSLIRATFLPFLFLFWPVLLQAADGKEARQIIEDLLVYDKHSSKRVSSHYYEVSKEALKAFEALDPKSQSTVLDGLAALATGSRKDKAVEDRIGPLETSRGRPLAAAAVVPTRALEVYKLIGSKDSRYIPRLEDGLKNTDSKVRVAAIQALSHLESGSSIRVLAKLAQDDPNIAVGKAALGAVKELAVSPTKASPEDRAAVGRLLIEIVEKKSKELAPEAISALGYLQPPGTMAVLEKLLEGKIPDHPVGFDVDASEVETAKEILRALVKIGDRPAIGLFEKTLMKATTEVGVDPELLQAAASALGLVKPESESEAASILLRLLDAQNDPISQRTLIRALREMGGKARVIVPLLVERLKKGPYSQRVVAAELLGSLADRKSPVEEVSALKGALMLRRTDSSITRLPSLWRAAKGSLGSLGLRKEADQLASDAIEWLGEKLQSSDERTRVQAIQALSEIIGWPHEVVPDKVEWSDNPVLKAAILKTKTPLLDSLRKAKDAELRFLSGRLLYQIDSSHKGLEKDRVDSAVDFIRDTPPQKWIGSRFYFEDLRGQVSDKEAFDERIDQAMEAHAKEMDPCATVCRMLDSLPLWARAPYLRNPEYQKHRSDRDTWEYAMKSLSFLFVTKAAPFCKKGQEMVGRLIDDWEHGRTEKRPIEEREETQPSSIDRLVREGVLDPEKNAAEIELLKRFQREAFPTASRDKRDTSIGLKAIEKSQRGTPDDPLHPAATYGKQYHVLLLSQLLSGKALTASSRKKLEDSLARARAALTRDLDKYEILNRTEGRGSFFNLYLTVSSMTASTSLSPEVESSLKNTLAVSRTVDGKFSPPYYPVSGKLEKERVEKLRRENRADVREGAARALPLLLAAIQQENDPEEVKALKKELYQAVKTYRAHLPFLILNALGDDTHYGPDHFAPYYLYPSLPFFFSAIRLLSGEDVMSKEDKVELAKIRTSALRRFSLLLQSNGTFLKMGDERKPPGNTAADHLYHSSTAYVSPLAGLALIAAIEECNGKVLSASLGILDPSLFHRKKNVKGKKSSPGADHELMISPP